MAEENKTSKKPESGQKATFLVLKKVMGTQPLTVRGCPAPPGGWIAGVPVDIETLGLMPAEAQEIALKTGAFDLKEKDGEQR